VRQRTLVAMTGSYDVMPLRRTFLRRFRHLTCTGLLMNLHLTLAPLISLIAGILILVMPRLLNFIVAIYLIVIGLVGLFGAGNMGFH
jgi:hypothetical protein